MKTPLIRPQSEHSGEEVKTNLIAAMITQTAKRKSGKVILKN